MIASWRRFPRRYASPSIGWHQEALRNAQRHGAASSVTISLSDRAGGVVIRIHDHGQGFDVGAPQGASGEHLGIISMQERAEILGGWLQVESEPRNGTMVECWLPLSETVRAPSPGVYPDRETAEATHVRTGYERSTSAPELNDLSPREREIADLLSLGHTTPRSARSCTSRSEQSNTIDLGCSAR